MKSFALWVDLMMYESVRLSVTEFVSLKMGLKGTPWNFLVCSLPTVFSSVFTQWGKAPCL